MDSGLIPGLTLQSSDAILQQRREEEQSNARSQVADSSSSDDDRRDVSTDPILPPVLPDETGNVQMDALGPFVDFPLEPLMSSDFLMEGSEVLTSERLPNTNTVATSIPSTARPSPVNTTSSSADGTLPASSTRPAAGGESEPTPENRENGRFNVRLRVPPGAHIHVVGPNGSLRRIERPRNMMGGSPIPISGSSGGRNVLNNISNAERNHAAFTLPINSPPDAASGTASRVASSRVDLRPGGGFGHAGGIGRNPTRPSPNHAFLPGVPQMVTIAGPADTVQVNIPRLESHILPDSKQDLVDVEQENEERLDLETFKCTVCFEYMAKAYGHSGCTTRVCESCAERLAALAKTQNPTGELRCPTCRNHSRFEEDKTMSSSIANSPLIRCRYESCNRTDLRLCEVEKHEAVCPAVKVTCLYSSFGCSWIGPRRDLANHEECDCALARVSGLVEQHRELLANFQRVSFHLQARHNGIFQLHQVLQNQVQNLTVATRQHQRLQRSAIREVVASTIPIASPNNPIHVAEYLVALFSNTSHMSSGRWKRMESVEAIANIFNQLMLVPVFLLSTSFCCRKISLISHSSLVASGQEMDPIDSVVSCFCAFIATFVLFFSFGTDRASSQEWQSVRLQVPYGSDPLAMNLGSLVAICSALLFGLVFLSAEEGAGWGYTCFCFVFISTFTFLFPVLFLATLKSRQEVSISCNECRAAQPILDGVLMGFLWVQGSGYDLERLPSLLIIIFSILLKSSNLSNQATVLVAGIPAIACVAFWRWASHRVLNLAALLMTPCVSWIVFRCVVSGIAKLAEASFSPRVELSLLLCVFGWALLLAV